MPAPGWLSVPVEVCLACPAGAVLSFRRAVALAGLAFAEDAFGLGAFGAVLVPAGGQGFGELLGPGRLDGMGG